MSRTVFSQSALLDISAAFDPTTHFTPEEQSAFEIVEVISEVPRRPSPVKRQSGTEEATDGGFTATQSDRANNSNANGSNNRRDAATPNGNRNGGNRGDRRGNRRGMSERFTAPPRNARGGNADREAFETGYRYELERSEANRRELKVTMEREKKIQDDARRANAMSTSGNEEELKAAEDVEQLLAGMMLNENAGGVQTRRSRFFQGYDNRPAPQPATSTKPEGAWQSPEASMTALLGKQQQGGSDPNDLYSVSAIENVANLPSALTNKSLGSANGMHSNGGRRPEPKVRTAQELEAALMGEPNKKVINARDLELRLRQQAGPAPQAALGSAQPSNVQQRTPPFSTTPVPSAGPSGQPIQGLHLSNVLMQSQQAQQQHQPMASAFHYSTAQQQQQQHQSQQQQQQHFQQTQQQSAWPNSFENALKGTPVGAQVLPAKTPMNFSVQGPNGASSYAMMYPTASGMAYTAQRPGPSRPQLVQTQPGHQQQVMFMPQGIPPFSTNANQGYMYQQHNSNN